MTKRKLHRVRRKVNNPNPKHLVEHSGDALATLTRIRQKMVIPGEEVSPKMIAPYILSVKGKKVTDSYIRQVIRRNVYASLDRLIEIESVIDAIQKG